MLKRYCFISGDKVRFERDFDIFPQVCVPKNSLGHICGFVSQGCYTELEGFIKLDLVLSDESTPENCILVRLDKHISSLNEWDNIVYVGTDRVDAIIMYSHEPTKVTPEPAVKVVDL